MHAEKTPYKVIQERLNGIVEKSPLNDAQVAESGDDMLALVQNYFGTPDVMARDYEQRCRTFLESVKHNQGLPVRSILSEDGGGKIIPTTGDLNSLWTILDGLLIEAVEKYRAQISQYYRASLAEFMEEVNDFLGRLRFHTAGTKSLKDEIQILCQDFRRSIKWGKTFDTLKNGCFPQVVSNAFSINSGAIAAQWTYSVLDEQMDYPTHDHKLHDGQVYAVRGAWADQKGFLSNNITYLDTVTPELLDVGCCCSLIFFFNLSDLPNYLLSDSARTILIAMDEGLTVPSLATPSVNSSELESQEVPQGNNQRGKGLRGLLRRILGRPTT